MENENRENGRTAIAWTQTELDGLEAAPLAQMAVGASWSWRGRGLILTDARASGLGHSNFSNAVRLLSDNIHLAAVETANEAGATFELSNGAQRFIAELVWIDGEELPVLLFENGCPDPDQEFWISKVSELSETELHAPTVDDTVVAFPVPRAFAEDALDGAQPKVLTAGE